MRISDWSSDVCSSDLIARQQAFVPFAKVEQDRAAFEQANVAVAQHRNLAPRLVAIMVRRPVDGADEMLGIVYPPFLALPARAHVADEAAREVGDPVGGGEWWGGGRVGGGKGGGGER